MSERVFSLLHLRYIVIASALLCASAVAQELPTPLRLADVARIATQQRAEIGAARARAQAAAQRPAIVGALEDPTISPSIDHYPYRMMEEEGARGRYDWSIAFEQRFPLSDIRTQRRRSAQADARRADADANRIRLDVVLEAQTAYFMLRERRAMQRVLEEQLALSRQLVVSATARYAGGKGAQAEVLRAEVEVARALAAQRALLAETRAAEAMLNANLGRAAAAPIPQLDYRVRTEEPPLFESVRAQAMAARPELMGGASEVERAAAEIDVMSAMYRPMAMIRLGPSSTMAEGSGAMVMIGISIPLWRDR